MVSGDRNQKLDVFVRDLVNNRIFRMSVDADGNEKEGTSQAVRISADGRIVVFRSDAPGLVPEDANDRFDIFVAEIPQNDAFLK